MAKKKVSKKKTQARPKVKLKAKLKAKPKMKARPKTSVAVLKKKTRKASKLLWFSLATFLVSIVLYSATSIDVLEAVFGFIAILAGAVVILAVISEIVFYLLKRVGKK